MLIIVEGPDGVGKTTACHELAEEIRAPLYKPALTPLKDIPVSESQAEDRGAWGVALLLPPDVDIIFDRAFPSEWTYGMAFGRHIEEPAIWQFDRMVAAKEHVAFLVTADHPRARVDDITLVKWHDIKFRYDQYVERSTMDWVVYNEWPDVTDMRREIGQRRRDKVHRTTLQ